MLHCACLGRLCAWELKVLKRISKALCIPCALEVHEGVANVSVVLAAAAWKKYKIIRASETDRVDGCNNISLTEAAWDVANHHRCWFHRGNAAPAFRHIRT